MTPYDPTEGHRDSEVSFLRREQRKLIALSAKHATLRSAALALSAQLDASCGADPVWKAEHDALKDALGEGE